MVTPDFFEEAYLSNDAREARNRHAKLSTEILRAGLEGDWSGCRGKGAERDAETKSHDSQLLDTVHIRIVESDQAGKEGWPQNSGFSTETVATFPADQGTKSYTDEKGCIDPS